MRITRDILLKLARDAVSQRVAEDRGVVAAYLCGSLLGEDYLLGGTADIDLVFLHISQPPLEREIIHLTDDVHLDIAHHAQKSYNRTRELRLHPWLGPTLTECAVLYDPQHFLNFTQASVRGQFERPDRVVVRARKLLDSARQIWASYDMGVPDPTPKDIEAYLRAVGHAANAVALISGKPLTERRFLLKFPEVANSIGRPGLFPGVMGLLGAPKSSAEQISTWLPAWQMAYSELPVDALPVRLHPDRLGYYQRAFQAFLESEQPLAVLWPLLRTWTLAACNLPAGSNGRSSWMDACIQLDLLYEAFVMRVSALDSFLDLVDETLETWAEKNGVWTT